MLRSRIADNKARKQERKQESNDIAPRVDAC